MKRLSRLLGAVLSFVAALFLCSGCTFNRHRTEEATAYVNAQKELAVNRKPLFELRAQPGQTITLSGVESLVVNDPREVHINPLPQRQGQAAPFLLGIAKMGLQYFLGDQQKDLALGVLDVLGRNAGDHSTTNYDNSFNQRGDEINDSNLISGNVDGDGAGIGNAFDDADSNVETTLSGDGSALGNDNVVDNQEVGHDRIEGDRNQNSGRQDADGPYDNSGGECVGGDGGEGGNGGATGTGGMGAGGGGTNCSGGG